jgi:lysophospholipase L1-like esterase
MAQPTHGISEKQISQSLLDLIESGKPTDYATIVYFNSTNPTTATIFDNVNPPVTNDPLLEGNVANLYIGTDNSTWVYNGTNYSTKVVAASSNFYINGTNTDAGNNKTSAISRTGPISVDSGEEIAIYGEGSLAGVYGFCDSSGDTLGDAGVIGVGKSNAGVWGYSDNHFAVYGTSGSGIGVRGHSTLGIAGEFGIGALNTEKIATFKKGGTEVASIDGNGIITGGNFVINKTLKYASLGDSITEGTLTPDGLLGYPNRINTKVGFSSFINLAQGGTTVKPTVGRPDLNDQVAAVPVGTDLITLMIGLNDYSLGNTLGSVTDVLSKSYDSLDRTLSIFEAFRYNLETLKINFPLAKIFVITPINTTTGDPDLNLVVEGEISIANYLSVTVINARDGSGIYSGSPYFGDTVHPNNAGQILLADFVLSKMRIFGDSTRASNLNNVVLNGGVSNYPIEIKRNEGGVVTQMTLTNDRIPGTDNGVELLFKGYYPLSKNTSKASPTLGPEAVHHIQVFKQSNEFNTGFVFTGTTNALLVNTINDNGLDKLQVNGSIKGDVFKANELSILNQTNVEVASISGQGHIINALIPKEISGTYTLLAEDAGRSFIITVNTTVTIPNGLPAGFNAGFSTLAGAVLTFTLGVSVIVPVGQGLVMQENSDCAIVPRLAVNSYLIRGAV